MPIRRPTPATSRTAGVAARGPLLSCMSLYNLLTLVLCRVTVTAELQRVSCPFGTIHTRAVAEGLLAVWRLSRASICAETAGKGAWCIQPQGSSSLLHLPKRHGVVPNRRHSDSRAAPARKGYNVSTIHTRSLVTVVSFLVMISAAQQAAALTPVPDITIVDRVAGGVSVTFDASRSSPTCDITNYRWDFGVETEPFNGDDLEPDLYVKRHYKVYAGKVSIWHDPHDPGGPNGYVMTNQAYKHEDGDEVFKVTVTPAPDTRACWGLFCGGMPIHAFSLSGGEISIAEPYANCYWPLAGEPTSVPFDQLKPVYLQIRLTTAGVEYFWGQDGTNGIDWHQPSSECTSTTTNAMHLKAEVTSGTATFDDQTRPLWMDQPTPTLTRLLTHDTSVRLTLTDSTKATASFPPAAQNPLRVNIDTYDPEVTVSPAHTVPTAADVDLMKRDGALGVTFTGSGADGDPGDAIMKYVWEFPPEDFSKHYLIRPGPWLLSGASVQDGELVVTPVAKPDGSYDPGYAFANLPVPRVKGQVFECVAAEHPDHAIYGFKDSAHGFLSDYMAYAFELSGTGIGVRERANYYDGPGYTPGRHLRIILNDGGGATYWTRSADTESWTWFCSTAGTSAGDPTTPLLPGVLVVDPPGAGTATMDDLKRTVITLPPPAATVGFPVETDMQVDLTVYDKAGRSSTATADVVFTEPGPEARFECPDTLAVNAYYVFDGTQSKTDMMSSCEWHFKKKDSPEPEVVKIGPKVCHEFTSAGQYTVTLAVGDWQGKQHKLTKNNILVEPKAICVPWDYSGQTQVPHTVVAGQETTLKAVLFVPANTQAGDVQFYWDYDDTPGDDTNSGGQVVSSNPTPGRFVIEWPLTYSGPPREFNATVHVNVGGQDLTSTYPIRIQEPTQAANVNIAIEKGLWRLHKMQKLHTALKEDGWWLGLSANPPATSSGYKIAGTAAAVNAMEVCRHRPSASRSVNEDPLVDDVIRGLAYMVDRLEVAAVDGGGGPDPDSNRNGIGVYAPTGTGTRPIVPSTAMYETGMAVEALAATYDRNLVVGTKDAKPGVAGRTCLEIVQDMCDWLAWGQTADYEGGKGQGGWRYTPDFDSTEYNRNNTSGCRVVAGNADNSASQWAVVAFLAAQHAFQLNTDDLWRENALSSSSWIKQANATWIGYTEVLSGSNPGFFGYVYDDTVGRFEATTAAGMLQLVFSRNQFSKLDYDNRWLPAEHWLADNWSGLDSSAHLAWGPMDNPYAYYAFVKAMRLADSPQKTLTDSSGSSFDWYSDSGKGLITRLLTDSATQQRSDGTWQWVRDPRPSSNYYIWVDEFFNNEKYHGDPESNIPTAWCVMVLSPTHYNRLPIADFKVPARIYEGAPATLDATYSRPNDDKAIQRYRWTFDGDVASAIITNISTIPHTWQSHGDHKVTLEVSCDGLQWGHPCVQTVHVLDLDPIIRISGPVTLGQNQSGTFRASTSYCVDQVSAVEWDWNNDGIFEDSGNKVRHSWPAAGTYTVCARAKDSDGSTTSAPLTVTVQAASYGAQPGGNSISVEPVKDYPSGGGGAGGGTPGLIYSLYKLTNTSDRPIRGQILVAVESDPALVADSAWALYPEPPQADWHATDWLGACPATWDVCIPPPGLAVVVRGFSPACAAVPYPYVDISDVLGNGNFLPGTEIYVQIRFSLRSGFALPATDYCNLHVYLVSGNGQQEFP
jgi:hypothetical protein